MLSDADILTEMERGNIICEPFVRENLSNSSLDLRLGGKIKKLTPGRFQSIEFIPDEYGKVKAQYHNCDYEQIDITNTVYYIKPREFILASTLEFVGQPCNFIVSEVADKSTLARAGLGVCMSAGYIDAGNVLNITLEIVNHNTVPIVLHYGQHICQLIFSYLNTPATKKYSGKYLNSQIVEEAK